MSWAANFFEDGKAYLEQFRRLERWNKILNEIRVSNSPDEMADYQVDCIYSFFMNCYHLTDWLKNTEPKQIDENKIYDFINKNRELKICHDVCNGSKHLNLKRPKCGGMLTLHREYDPFHEIIKSDKPLHNSNYVLIADGEKFDVFDLANRCLELWQKFLRDNSLL